MNWILRQIERLRSFNPLVVDGVLAAILLVLGLVTVYTQDVKTDGGGGRLRAPVLARIT